ncbi:hypothetical protein Ancab_008277 [Ancistrocladus abbreviatus]
MNDTENTNTEHTQTLASCDESLAVDGGGGNSRICDHFTGFNRGEEAGGGRGKGEAQPIGFERFQKLSLIGWLPMGVSGAYSELAAETAYPNSEAVPCGQFDTAFEVSTLNFYCRMGLNVRICLCCDVLMTKFPQIFFNMSHRNAKSTNWGRVGDLPALAGKKFVKVAEPPFCSRETAA